MDSKCVIERATTYISLEVHYGRIIMFKMYPPHLPSPRSDFKAERNILPQFAYPKLEEFCAARGIDFQVVDMRWGVTDELVHDHQVSSLCISEIKTCQQLSCGPNFVVSFLTFYENELDEQNT